VKTRFSRLTRGPGLVLAAAVLLAILAVMVQAQEANRKIVKVVSAEYPEILKQRGIGGVVKMRVVVRANGTVKDAEAIGGNPILSDCAVKAVKQWIFAPASEEAKLEISISFDPKS